MPTSQKYSGAGGPRSLQVFAPDSSVLLTGSENTATLYDSPLGLSGHDTPVHSVEYSADGSMLVSADRGGVVRVWALDIDDLVQLAEEELTRGFTEAECRQFLHVDTCPGEAAG